MKDKMETKQQKIIKEILDEKIKDFSIQAMVVLGSVSIGKERKNSDIDISIISDKAKEYFFDQKEKRCGVKIDLEIIPSKDFKRWIKDYPYLWYDYHKRHRIMFDKKGIVKEAIKYLKDYFDCHSDVVDFWKEKLKAMEEAKRKGRKPENCYRVFDETEIRFSKEHKVTRDFYRD
jgi:predicted nucleotidyltransferase